ncbi:MAG TPA: glycosyltransferase family 4 protein [Gemmatimonadales bacterium]|nr:glycosyltransferase family 4 protein [Gemmatimonadales bacterium]
MRAMILARLYANPLDRGKLRALAGLGAELTVLVPDISGAPDRSRFETEGNVRIVPVPARGSLEEPDELGWSSRAIRRAIRDARPELLQVEEEPWSVVVRKAAREARRAGIPLVGFSRMPWPLRLPTGASRRRRQAMEAVAAIAATSALAAEPLRRERPDLTVSVIPQSGVDVPASVVQRNDGTVNIGFIGRLVAERGLDLVLPALTRLGGGWRLLVSGTGPEQIALEALAERLGIAASVTWLGAQPRAQRLALLQELDILVSTPRDGEGWQELIATPVMLAMAHGIPVVGSRHGVLPERLGDAGMLVPPDDGEALAEALGELVRDQSQRHALGLAARRRAQEEFSHHAVAQRCFALWQQLMAAV